MTPPRQTPKARQATLRAQAALEKRIRDGGASLSRADVIKTLKAHVTSMNTRGASGLSTAVVLRAAELLEEGTL